MLDNVTKKKRGATVLVIANIICYCGILFNATRGAWLAIAVAALLCFFAYYKQSKMVVLLGLVICLGFCIIVQTNDYYKQRLFSITSADAGGDRLLIWQSSMHMIEDYPITGVGPGMFTEQYQHKYILPQAKEPGLRHAHNIYLQICSENGLIGLMSYLSLFGYLLINNFRKYLYTKNCYHLLIFTTTLCILIQGITEFNGSTFKTYWLIVGWSCLMLHKRKESY